VSESIRSPEDNYMVSIGFEDVLRYVTVLLVS